jgi:hypothetical protein
MEFGQQKVGWDERRSNKNDHPAVIDLSNKMILAIPIGH